MRDSVFSTIWKYLLGVIRSARSVAGTAVATFPYLFGAGESRREVTEEYPDPVSSRTEDDLPARSRGLLFNDIDKCTGCGECERVCPVRCVRVQAEPGPEAAKKWVSVFDIDFGKCMFCGMCVEVCEPASLVHTRQYEGAVFRLGDLVTSFGRGPVTVEQREKWRIMRSSQELDAEPGR